MSSRGSPDSLRTVSRDRDRSRLKLDTPSVVVEGTCGHESRGPARTRDVGVVTLL